MAIAPELEKRIGRGVDLVAQGFAIAGGLVLVGMAGVTAASVTGRALSGFGLSNVTGDFELVQLGCAVAVFWFLPLCQMRRANVTVDLVSERFGPRGHAVLGMMGNLALLLCSVVIARQLARGFGEKFPHGSPAFRDALGLGAPPFFPETTYELQLPIWIPYGLALLGAVWLTVVCAFTVWRSLNWVLAGQEPRAT
ncbi:TRAP transporter small permease [Meridianimarinicoccus aquatilis]|uniref:TRAP transporter small permease protein n=1 Tax=Meridianimarinicoccus aquatilis TaxID=2552766 RepID=A0A4R6B2C4_9RHOB|nr:TRAP transporter small permease [Fluviibacterium aquatile]TDL90760.1 TRAP transporter small permease [Fluviibacterium aquatile]